MSFVTDFRSRAEDALEQGKQAFESAIGSAQNVTVAGRTLSFEALVADLEDLVKRYRDSANGFVSSQDDRIGALVERAEAILNEVKRDKRVSQLVERAETVYDALYETVAGRVVNPALDLIGKSPVAKSPAKPVVKPTVAKPTAAKATAAKAPAKKAAAAKKAPAAKAVPAKKAPAKSATAAVKKAAPAKKAAAAKKAPAKKATTSAK